MRRIFLLRTARVDSRLPRNFIAHRVQPQAAFIKNLGRHRTVFAEQAQQQMFGADVTVLQAIAFFVSVSQHAFGFRSQRQFDRR